MKITVEWGYEEHSITLTPRNWAKFISGRELRIRGKGYATDKTAETTRQPAIANASQ